MPIPPRRKRQFTVSATARSRRLRSNRTVDEVEHINEGRRQQRRAITRSATDDGNLTANFVKVLRTSTMAKTRDAAQSFDGNQSYHGEKLVYPAATRNQDPILKVLQTLINCRSDQGSNPLFLEIGSGSGQHLAYFAPHYPEILFQPTEFDESLFGSISYYASNCPTKNILQPLYVDIRNKLSCYGFKEKSIDYIYSANVIHISPYECTIGLFENAGTYLKPESLMITYGPYSKDGVITPESNVQFDASLRARNSTWGLRDISELIKLGARNNLILTDSVDMPSNNKTLIWKRN